jgi:hypothetical protein
MRTSGGYCILLTPAKSAPAYEHQLQQNATTFFSGLSSVAASIWAKI